MEPQILVNTAQMLTNLTAAELIHLIHKSVEEVTVVAHYDSRTVKGADSLLQHILRLHIQVVRRLVEDKEVNRLKQQTDHCQTRAFTARKHLYVFVACLATEHERAEDILYLQTNLTLRHVVYGLEHREVLVEQLRLILREVANLRVVAHLQSALVVNLAHDALHER